MEPEAPRIIVKGFKKEDRILSMLQNSPNGKISIKTDSIFVASVIWMMLKGKLPPQVSKKAINSIYDRLCFLLEIKTKNHKIRYLLKIISALLCFRLTNVQSFEKINGGDEIDIEDN